MSGINWVKGSQKNGFDLGDSGCFNLQTNFFSFENSKVSSFFDIIILGGGGVGGRGCMVVDGNTFILGIIIHDNHFIKSVSYAPKDKTLLTHVVDSLR